MKCMVIDGNSIINRAYYGIRPLTNREGLYTHAVFGFLTTLLRLKEEERPDALCVTFDLHAPTFRHKADEAYKATRKPMPEELRMQVPVLKEVLDTLNIPRYEMEGWEADDLIGTISRKCEAAGWDCVVVTGDKDSLQLITDRTKVKLVSTRMGQTTTKDMTPETFREQYGFEPIHMIDLKALMGDTSDNIPGVPGVGEKTAMDLIQKYGSVDAIYEKLPDIDAKPAAIKKLTAGEDAARHSYWLATIVTDAPLSFDPAENRVQEPTPAAYPLFLKLEFSKLIEKMNLRPEEAAPVETAPDVTVTVECVTAEEQARKLEEKLKKNRLTLTDYMEQMDQLQKMGNLGQLAGMLPGDMGKQLDAANLDEKQLGRTRAIIQSMTPLERENPSIIGASRKKRIAAGCGLEVVDVNRLLKSFEMLQQLTKSISKGRFGGFGGPGGMPTLGKAKKGKLQGFGRKKRLK